MTIKVSVCQIFPFIYNPQSMNCKVIRRETTDLSVQLPLHRFRCIYHRLPNNTNAVVLQAPHEIFQKPANPSIGPVIWQVLDKCLFLSRKLARCIGIKPLLFFPPLFFRALTQSPAQKLFYFFPVNRGHKLVLLEMCPFC